MSDIRRPHPVYIFQSMSRYLPLLLIPPARALYTAALGRFAAPPEVEIADILLLLAVVALGTLRWRLASYSVNADRLVLAGGILLRKKTVIPLQNITALSAHRPLLYRPFGAVRIGVDTAAGSHKKVDFITVVHEGEWRRILALRESGAAEAGNAHSYNPGRLALFLLSLVTSNSLAGTVLLATVLSKLGDIAGRGLPVRLLSAVDRLAGALAFAIPSIVAAIGLLLLGGWCAALVLNFVSHIGFRAERRGRYLRVRSGLAARRQHSLAVSRINYIDIRQSLASRLLGVHSVFLHVSGYGKSKRELATLIPASRYTEVESVLSKLLPEYRPGGRGVAPARGSLPAYCGGPLTLLGALAAVAALLVIELPGLRALLLPLAFAMAVPLLWLLAVCALGARTAGVSLHDDVFTLRYPRGFYLHTVVLPAAKASGICLRQNMLQRARSRCDMVVYSASERRERHVIKGLSYSAAGELLQQWRGQQ